MEDALLIVDAINDFRNEEGEALLASFRERHSTLVDALEKARKAGIPIVYVNDHHRAWDGDAPRLVRNVVEGEAGDLVETIGPPRGRPVRRGGTRRARPIRQRLDSPCPVSATELEPL